MKINHGFTPAMVALLAWSTTSSGAEEERHFTVADDIAMARFVSVSSGEETRESTVGLFSPDRSRFLVLTQQGLLETNELQSTLWLYETARIRSALERGGEAPAPRVLAKLASISNEPPISQVAWTCDGSKLTFLGRNGESAGHVFEVDVKTGSLLQLTPEDQNVIGLHVGCGLRVYIVNPPYSPPPGMTARVLTGLSLQQAFFPEHLADLGLRPNGAQLGLIRAGVARILLDAKAREPVTLNYNIRNTRDLWISPDERWAVAPRLVERMPAMWQAYAPDHPTYALRAPRGEETPALIAPIELSLINLDSGESKPIVQAPIARSLGYSPPAVKWLPDGRTILLSRVFLPVDGVDGEERGRRAGSPAIFTVDLHTGRTRIVAFDQSARWEARRTTKEYWRLDDVSYDAATSEIIVRYELRNPRTMRTRSQFYRATPTGWRLHRETTEPIGKHSSVADDEAIRIHVRQDLNAPPILVATGTGAERTLWDPNPQLEAIDLGEASFYRWNSEGAELEGVLIKPPRFQAGHRYPLVVQHHSHAPPREFPRFIGTGPFNTAWVGRAMAARDTLVIQMNNITPHPSMDGDDAPRNVAAYRALVQKLSEDGLIDPARVGIVGFSYNGFYVRYALAHDPGLFAAAIVADSNTYGIFDYLANANTGGYFRQFEQVLGGHPFAPAGLANWQRNSPLFHFENVRTPLRIESHDDFWTIAHWGEYAALRILDRPVDLIQIADASHNVMKPLERMASQQGAVEWFDFWLNGREDADPQKVAQYRRWQAMRTQQQAMSR